MCLALAASCSREKTTKEQRWSFAEEGVVFDAEFLRARLSECERIGPGEYGMVIRPENMPVNNSPWFAFKVSAAKERPIVVRLRCQGGSVRYRPKISLDGTQWVTLPAEAYETGPGEHECTLRLEAGPQTLWVAAQELVSTDEMMAWARTLERLPFVTYSQFGQSINGRPMFRLDVGKTDAARHVSIIGRQHPPETTGSLALMRFVEEIAGDSELARTFRQEFHVLVMPLINPDGVDAGHWRHNLGHVDLNRDWGPFAQPETKAAAEQIAALSKPGRLFLHLDFHSTFKDVFYTQADDEPSSPAGFTARWLEGIQKRVPEYAVNREASPTPKPTTSAYWAHHTFGIPSITYEIGDNTDRALLKRVAANAAQEMMTLLLEMKDAK
ncbi:MAG: M14 family metallopeptidase [Prosthecobacter sp.]|uniref:M14 family metallopeptidase n=1 Tax=Prosthecobacter sp. TaxID=1965333 RepID=UPI0038FF8217